MCFGGGGGGGTITMPDTGAYDRMYDQQVKAMEMAQSTEMTAYQSQLQAAQREQGKALRELSDYRTEQAETAASVEAEARRMANIVGPPPPEETAKAPVVGRDRSGQSGAKTGKRRLRIGRSSYSTSGVGTGLNIT